MNYILTFIISFLVIYILYYLVIINRKKGLESFKKGKQLQFFIKAYNLNKNKINIKKFANTLSLANAFIIALTLTILELIENIFFKILTSIFILLPLMFIMYKLIGEAYKRKEGK